jgi:hypothetical protein
VLRTAATDRLVELAPRESREQRTAGAEQVDVQGATGGRLEAARADGIESGEQCPEMFDGDRLPLHFGDAGRPTHHVRGRRVREQ